MGVRGYIGVQGDTERSTGIHGSTGGHVSARDTREYKGDIRVQENT